MSNCHWSCISSSDFACNQPKSTENIKENFKTESTNCSTPLSALDLASDFLTIFRINWIRTRPIINTAITISASLRIQIRSERCSCRTLRCLIHLIRCILRCICPPFVASATLVTSPESTFKDVVLLPILTTCYSYYCLLLLLSSLHFHIRVSLFLPGQEMHSMFHVHFLLFCVRTKYPGCSVYIHWSLQYAPEEFLILKTDLICLP